MSSRSWASKLFITKLRWYPGFKTFPLNQKADILSVAKMKTARSPGDVPAVTYCTPKLGHALCGALQRAPVRARFSRVLGGRRCLMSHFPIVVQVHPPSWSRSCTCSVNEKSTGVWNSSSVSSSKPRSNLTERAQMAAGCEVKARLAKGHRDAHKPDPTSNDTVVSVHSLVMLQIGKHRWKDRMVV